MRLGILGIALSMAVLTIDAAPEPRTQEAANTKGTSDQTSKEGGYKKIPTLYPSCGNYTKSKINMKFRLSIESSLWDRLVPDDAKYGNYPIDVMFKFLEAIFKFSGDKLKTLAPQLFLKAELDQDDGTTRTLPYNALPSDDSWITKWDRIWTPITDVLKGGKLINILLIDGLNDDENNYKCLTTQEGNTIVQALGEPFYEYDDDLFEKLYWTTNYTVLNMLEKNIFEKISAKLGIQKWESTEERLDDNTDLCEGLMEGFWKKDFSTCSSNEFQQHLDSPGGHSMNSVEEIYKTIYAVTFWVRVFANVELAKQFEKQHKLKSTKDAVLNGLYNAFNIFRNAPRLTVYECDAEGITVFPWHGKIEGSGMTDLEDALATAFDDTSRKTPINLIMLDKNTYDSISDNLPGHQEQITCKKENAISARSIFIWTEPGDKNIKNKVKELTITLAKKIGMRDNRESTEVIKDSDGSACNGIMEGGRKPISQCSTEDFSKYLRSDEGRCLTIEVPWLHYPCQQKPSCKERANRWTV